MSPQTEPRIPLPKAWNKHSGALPRPSCWISNHYGNDRKPWFKTRPEYSDEPSYRVRQKVHFSSERLRSLLRKIDRFLAVTT